MSARARRKENSARPSGANEVTFGLNEPLVESPTDAVATDKPTAYFGMGFGHCRGNQAYRNLVLSNQSEYLKSATQRRQIVLDVMRLFRFQQDGAPAFPSRIRNSLTALSYPSRVRKKAESAQTGVVPVQTSKEPADLSNPQTSRQEKSLITPNLGRTRGSHS
jgi:hypothetical protein